MDLPDFGRPRSTIRERYMTAATSLRAIAAAVGGRVIGGRTPHVAAPFPGKSKRDRSLHIFINGDDIGVHTFRAGVDPIAIKDHVRQLCGLPRWRPKRQKPTSKADISFAVRNHFFGETLAVCRLRRHIPPDHLALLINDLRLRGDTSDAIKYIREFGFGPDDLARCLAATPRHYFADERAKILNLTYAERQQLSLRRTGSVDLDKTGRERARRDRYNAKRREKRAAARQLGVNKINRVEARPSSNQKEEGITISDELTALQASLTMDQLGEYLARGRPLRASTDDELRDLYITSIRHALQNGRTFSGAIEAGLELSLRGLKEPRCPPDVLKLFAREAERLRVTLSSDEDLLRNLSDDVFRFGRSFDQALN